MRFSPLTTAEYCMYRLEELHVSEWEECDSHGMKKVYAVLVVGRNCA